MISLKKNINQQGKLTKCFKRDFSFVVYMYGKIKNHFNKYGKTLNRGFYYNYCHYIKILFK